MNELNSQYEQAKKILESDPNHSQALAFIGSVLFERGEHNEAIIYLLRAIYQDSSNADYFNLLGLCYLGKNDFENSILTFDKAINFNPKVADFFSNKAIALFKRFNFKESVDFFSEAIKLDSNFFEAYNGRGNAFKAMQLFNEALHDYNKSLEINPNYSTAYFCKGNLYKETKNYEEAIKSYDQAIAIIPNYIDALWNKSHCLLMGGAYVDGWRLYESRWDTKYLKKSIRNFKQSKWTGKEPISGKRIFIYSEQGLGDIIQFSRYLIKLSDMGAEVIFEVPDSLIEIFKTLKGNIHLIKHKEETPEFDYHSALMSLPLCLDTRVKTIPSFKSYLYIDQNKSADWEQILGEKNKFRVGLVWSGGIHALMEETSVTEKKSIALKNFEKLKNVSADFYSLQKGAESEKELKVLMDDNWAGPKLINYAEKINDFSDTASLIDKLDLVISVCTSVAHLSGALGKTTWILVPYNPCWRWFDDQSNVSPWYPSVRLFRQLRLNDWDEVIEEVHNELIKITSCNHS